MAEPMSTLSPGQVNATSTSLLDDDYDMTFHDPQSSPFVSHLDNDNQENIAPEVADTPLKSMNGTNGDVMQSAFKNAPVLKGATSPEKASPVRNLMKDFIKEAETPSQRSHNNESPSKIATLSLLDADLGAQAHDNNSPSKSSHIGRADMMTEVAPQHSTDFASIQRTESNGEGSTGSLSRQISNDGASAFDLDVEIMDMHPDGPSMMAGDVDDTCFSTFSEMPGLDLTTFAALRQSPTKRGLPDATPRGRPQATPATVRHKSSPSPTPRRTYKENDTTNLLLDFTAQIESFSSSRRISPARSRTSPSKSTTEPNLRSFYHNQRSPAKSTPNVPSTPSQSRQMLNLLDFELPPPPTPRSQPTVTIREMESVKSQFQSQVSSLTASLSGKEAEIDSLSKAIADAERRVGEAQELVRDERSAREHAEAQMIDWKKKGEEVTNLLQDVQSELARNDSEREQLLAQLAAAEKRAESAENRAADLETKVIEAESKNVDMTTFINADEDENKKMYSEMECQAAIAEKVNEVARDLHAAYKAKHEKKIKALKENYQKKADERCKELRVQIIRLERQVEEAEKKRDNTFSKILPVGVESSAEDVCDKCGKSAQAPAISSGPSAEDAKKLEAYRTEIEGLKAKLSGLQSELQSLHKSHDTLSEELEAERIEKGELVAAAEQMLAMCGEKMEELQQEDLRRSQMNAQPAAPVQKRPPPQETAMRNTGFLAGNPAPARPNSALSAGRPGSATGDRSAKPSGLRAPGGFGFQGGASGLNRSTSGSKSRLLSNFEKML